jgi:mannosyl-glycoprotein endo-beta-N-acetylglucosaminidase
MIPLKYFRLLFLTYFLSGLFPLNIKAQIEPLDHSVNNKVNSYTSDQPFTSYWFPLEILNWSPSTDPDAPYNRSGVLLKNKYFDSITVVNPNARVNEAKVNPLSAFASTSDNPSQGSLNINYYTFSYWQYIDQLVFWGGSAGEGLILAPNPTLIDAAHRNGVKVLGNVFFRQQLMADSFNG